MTRNRFLLTSQAMEPLPGEPTEPRPQADPEAAPPRTPDGRPAPRAGETVALNVSLAR